MKEDFVSFELAKKLQEKGYPQHHSAFRSYFIGDDIPRIAEVGDVIYRTKIEGEEHLIACPTISQVLKWLRENYSIHIEIRLFVKAFGFDILEIHSKKKLAWSGVREFDSYEQAAIACIEYVLDNLI